MKLTVVILVIIILILVIFFLMEKKKTKNILKSLNGMIDLAIGDDFSEQNFDESLLSSIESKFYQYILANQNSKKLLIKEKNNVDELISDISHQTKTPLSNIIMYTELLGELEYNPQCDEYLKALENQVSKLKFLIESLIKSSRLESGIIKINVKENTTKKMIEMTIQTASQRAIEKQIDILNNAKNYKAVFDIKWTSEALFNILDNAIKYSEEGGVITIESEDYEFFSCIRIIDSGIGIPEEEVTKIFNRFYRSPVVSENEGVGIGLYLSRETISAQNGYIKVARNKEKGSIFSVYLPKKA